MSAKKLFFLLALFFMLVPGPGIAWQGDDLTGAWTDDAGGRYRIRQIGNTLVWFDDRSPVATNVFVGTISGDLVDGQWWDLPGAQLLGGGRLWLRIESGVRMVKTGSSPEYGGRVLTRAGAGASAVSAPSCTPAGTWNWVDNQTAVLQADGSVTHTSGYQARWQALGGGRYQLTWNNGSIDTLTLSADGRTMDGSNNAGRIVHVTCARPGSGGGAGVGAGGGAGLCADSRTQVVMDDWLMRANPRDNTRPGWAVHYDSWGRLVGRTPTSTITGLAQGVDTRLTRCEYLWSIASELGSTNLGTLRDHVSQRIR